MLVGHKAKIFMPLPNPSRNLCLTIQYINKLLNPINFPQLPEYLFKLPQQAHFCGSKFAKKEVQSCALAQDNSTKRFKMVQF